MDIATIQKRKFLNNIYRSLYSEGRKPSEQEVRKLFNRYFASNRPGLPISINYNQLQISDIIDVDLLNELMVSSLFNLEVLYDAVFENNQEIFGIVTALNGKLEGLRVRRKELEAKVDQIIFANSNSDGYYYSFFETFASLSNIDMNLTTAFVDIVNNNVTLPKITNVISDSLVTKQIFSAGATFSARFDSTSVVTDAVIENFDMVLDGLNDTYWNYDLKSDSPGIASVTITIPIDSSFRISKIDGSVLTSSPCTVYLRAISSTPGTDDQVRIKDSKEDYSRFSFVIPADSYSAIVLTLLKPEPDRFESSSSGMYIYTFGLRDLVVSSAYYDSRAVVISSPLSLPTADNSNLSISALSLEAKEEILPGTSIQYYVAADIPGSSEISSFNWLRVTPSDLGSSQNVVALVSSNVRNKFVDNFGADLTFIPESFGSEALLDGSLAVGQVSNANDLNPVTLPYSDKTVYRVCAIDEKEKIIEPYLLANLGTFNHYGMLLESSKIETEMYKSLNGWRQIINDTPQQLQLYYLSNQTTSINPGLFSASVGLLETKVMCQSDQVGTHVVTKSRSDFNLAIYLNGVQIADLPKGVSSKSVEWNFAKGNNNVLITYDKNFSGLISFNLMTGRNLDEYGTVFLDYFSYLDPIEFRNVRTTNANVFTIDKIYGRNELLSYKKITNRSILKYYTNTSDLITAVRYRADLVRFDNPLQTPVLDAVRLKFKHNDLSI